MASIYDWSKTADDNGAADAICPWPEGMARRQVNNSARGNMKRVAELRDDISAALASAGTANALTITPNSDFTALADGRIIAFRSATTNTGAATLNVNGLGAKAIRKFNTTGEADVIAGDIRENGIYIVMYSAALSGGSGAWCLLNPPSRSLVSETQQVTTSGTTVDFTGIPSGTRRIVIMLNAVSLTAPGGGVFVHIGDSGGIETTDYFCTAGTLSGTPSVALLTPSFDAFYAGTAASGSQSIDGQMVLSLINPSHRWIANGLFHERPTTPRQFTSVGNKALSAELDRVRVWTSGTAFDGGTVNIMYE